jgi:hypothetical protein
MTETDNQIDKILEKRELMSLKTSHVEYKLKLHNLKEAKRKLIASDVELVIEQLTTLKDLMSMTMLDAERTLFPNEQKWRSPFTDLELNILRKKIMNLVSKF